MWLESSLEVALPVELGNIRRSVRGWVVFIGSGVFIPHMSHSWLSKNASL
jgi:hypothetical protein